MAHTVHPTKKHIVIDLSPRQHDKLTSMAKEARMKPGLYAQLLFEAAFAARVGVQPDEGIDTVIARTALLWGAGIDDDIIARQIGISKKLVKRIMRAWQDEVLARAA